MKLYSFFNSSTSYRVRIALALKGIAYEYAGVNIRTGEQRSDAFIQLNPSKGVPLLVVDEEHSLTQSLAIIQYLDDTFPDIRLIPADTWHKARVLEVASVIATDIHQVNNLKTLGYLKQVLGVTEEQKNAWYHHWVKEGLTAAEALLNTHGFGTYCFGDTPTLADCCLVPQVANAQRMGCDLTAYPKIMAIYQHCQQQPAFIQAAPAQQPDYIA